MTNERNFDLVCYAWDASDSPVEETTHKRIRKVFLDAGGDYLVGNDNKRKYFIRSGGRTCKGLITEILNDKGVGSMKASIMKLDWVPLPPEEEEPIEPGQIVWKVFSTTGPDAVVLRDEDPRPGYSVLLIFQPMDKRTMITLKEIFREKFKRVSIRRIDEISEKYEFKLLSLTDKDIETLFDLLVDTPEVSSFRMAINTLRRGQPVHTTIEQAVAPYMKKNIVAV